MSYDPSGVGVKGSLFGFPYSAAEADLLIMPIPWDVTVSYGSGTVNGPVSIMEVSPQLDLSIYGVHKPWQFKSVMLPIPHEILHECKELRKVASALIEEMESGEEVKGDSRIAQVNEGTTDMVNYVYENATKNLEQGKLCAVLGGDHSTPLGLMKALGERQNFGILQIDAHMDLRKSYEGFQHSHASIMYNAMELSGIESLVQVGIRDFCEEEERYVSNSEKPVHVFYNDQLKAGMQHGIHWSGWVSNIIRVLPEKVYISFDIDGLTPNLCPNTGTPVPGGLDFDQAVFLIEEVVRSGKKIIGFDLCEVCPGSDEWDANVGARILYRLCTYMGISQGKISFS